MICNFEIYSCPALAVENGDVNSPPDYWHTDLYFEDTRYSILSVPPYMKATYMDQHLANLPSNQNAFDYVSTAFSLNRTQTTRELVNVGFPWVILTEGSKV